MPLVPEWMEEVFECLLWLPYLALSVSLLAWLAALRTLGLVGYTSLEDGNIALSA